jgi:hypothetical protein
MITVNPEKENKKSAGVIITDFIDSEDDEHCKTWKTAQERTQV